MRQHGDSTHARVMQGKISREDVAALCVALLDLPGGLDRTFEVSSTVPFSQPWEVDPANPPPPRDWAVLLADVRPGVTGKTVDGVWTGRQTEEEALRSVVA